MIEATRGAIDCDVHPAVPSTETLLPYLNDYWREQITTRGIEALDVVSYPPRNPLSGRQDWRTAQAKPGTSLENFQRDGLDHFGLGTAICNVVYGGQTLFNADFGAAVCKATNDWLVDKWLSKEPRLRGSITVPLQDPDLAVEEIERRAADKRFVQILLPATADMPLGRRYYWPIYKAAEKHGLPIGIHATHASRFASSYVGWPSHYIEDYAGHVQTFEGQLLSLVYEGVFNKFPGLKIVLLESGVTWLPSCMMRADTTWRSLRMEVPWIERSPTEIIREHIRLTTQPFDAPASAKDVDAVLDQLGSDEMLLFSSDYPHWQFDKDDVVPEGLSPAMVRKMMFDNPRKTYTRLTEASS